MDSQVDSRFDLYSGSDSAASSGSMLDFGSATSYDSTTGSVSVLDSGSTTGSDSTTSSYSVAVEHFLPAFS